MKLTLNLDAGVYTLSRSNFTPALCAEFVNARLSGHPKRIRATVRFSEPHNPDGWTYVRRSSRHYQYARVDGAEELRYVYSAARTQLPDGTEEFWVRLCKA